jgi:hypothetical protein
MVGLSRRERESDGWPLPKGEGLEARSPAEGSHSGPLPRESNRVNSGRQAAQGVLCLSMALRMVSSLRMQAVMASLKGLPAALSRSNMARMTGLQRVATLALPRYRSNFYVPRVVRSETARAYFATYKG